MKASNIKERINEIKGLIGRASFETAFEKLELLVTEIEGIKIENPEETELINQLIIIRSRYHAFTKKIITGVDEQQSELNQITNSLLKLTDSVHNLLQDNPDLIVPKEKEELTATLPISGDLEPTVVHPVTSAENGKDNSGCLLAFSKNDTNVNLEVKNTNWLKIFGGLSMLVLALGLAAGLFFLMRGCGSGSLPPVTPPPVDITDPVTYEPKPTDPGTSEPDPVRTFNSEAVSKVYNYAKDQKNTKAKSFYLNDFNFAKNSVALSAEAKKQLDEMVIVLKEFPNRRITLMGMIGPNEKAAYRGNKEITLGDVRGRKAYDYLKSKGVPITQMEFEGYGVDDRGGAGMMIRMK